MITWLLVIGIFYLSLLFSLAFQSRRKQKSVDEFMLVGYNIGTALGFMTFAATLFSTFTLIGMPDFFRIHGVGAWIFLAVSDGGMVFLILWFGYHLRQKVRGKGFRGMGGLLAEIYGHKLAGFVYFFGVFVFLIPYVAIQLRGMAIFLNAVFPNALTTWDWALLMVITLLIYSEIGGLKGIMYADFMQAIILMSAVWIIAGTCVSNLGGIESMFQQVKSINPALLSTPGPKDLFNVQFLIASFLAILLIPVTQPQLTTRIVVMRSLKAMHHMAGAVGTFAILVVLPTCAIEMYGAVKYPQASTADFIANVLLFDQHAAIAAITIVGLMAAALSTSDSQIFALGSKLRSLLKGEEQTVLTKTRIAIVIFGGAALLLSMFSSDELVLIARVSFAGTSLLAPMVFSVVLSKRRPGIEISMATLVGLHIFLGSLFGLVPSIVGTIRLDMLLLVGLAIYSLGSFFIRDLLQNKNHSDAIKN